MMVKLVELTMTIVREQMQEGGAGILFNNSSSGSGTFQFMSASDTDDDTYTVSEFMRIDASGNVGIGTTSPSYKLDVSGTARIDGSSYDIVDGSIDRD